MSEPHYCVWEERYLDAKAENAKLREEVLAYQVQFATVAGQLAQAIDKLEQALAKMVSTEQATGREPSEPAE